MFALKTKTRGRFLFGRIYTFAVPYPNAGASRTSVLNEGLPEWLYEWEGFKVQKRLLLNHDQNTVLVRHKSPKRAH